MTDRQRPPPPVTVTGGPDGALSQDLLVSEERPPRLSRRQRRGVAAGLVLLLVAGLVGRDLLDRRRTAEQDREQAGTVALRVAERGFAGSSGYDPANGVAEVAVTLLVRNDGPRDVVLTSGELGPLALDRSLPVPAGGEGRVRLTAAVACPEPGQPVAAPGPEAVGLDVLRLDVRTDAGPRTAEVPVGGDPLGVGDVLARACGRLPAAEAVGLVSNGGRLRGDRLVVTLDVRNQGVLPVLVEQVLVSPGFAVEVQRPDGSPLPLPAEVPGAVLGGPDVVLPLRLALRVQSCQSAGRPAQQPDEVPLGDVGVVVQGPGSEAPVLTDLQDNGQLPRLIERSC